MEYTYEFMKRCHGLRFRATLGNKPQEGIIKVMSEGVVLCYGEEDPGYLVTFGRRDTLSFSEQTFSILPSDFEIVPRDPETYKDWQVGDKIAGRYSDKGGEVIFRCGELVIYKDKDDGRASIPFTCEELFDNEDCRLVLTDIEQQIIEGQKEYEPQIIEGQKEYEPQDGDIVAWKDKDDDGNPAISIYKEKGRGYATIYAYGSTEYSTYVTFAMNIIRPATDEETRRLFDAMAKEGKWWNAEKKVVEDIPKESEPEKHDFKKFDPVLVRDGDDDQWEVQVFGRYGGEDEVFPYFIIDGPGYYQCIPLNEKTERLIYTNDNYKEEQS